MQLEFNAHKRDDQGTGASRRLRRTGRVPGILYGGAATPQIGQTTPAWKPCLRARKATAGVGTTPAD